MTKTTTPANFTPLPDDATIEQITQRLQDLSRLERKENASIETIQAAQGQALSLAENIFEEKTEDMFSWLKTTGIARKSYPKLVKYYNGSAYAKTYNNERVSGQTYIEGTAPDKPLRSARTAKHVVTDEVVEASKLGTINEVPFAMIPQLLDMNASNGKSYESEVRKIEILFKSVCRKALAGTDITNEDSRRVRDAIAFIKGKVQGGF